MDELELEEYTMAIEDEYELENMALDDIDDDFWWDEEFMRSDSEQ